MNPETVKFLENNNVNDANLNSREDSGISTSTICHLQGLRLTIGQGFCPWTPLGSRYRLRLPRSPSQPPAFRRNSACAN